MKIIDYIDILKIGEKAKLKKPRYCVFIIQRKMVKWNLRYLE